MKKVVVAILALAIVALTAYSYYSYDRYQTKLGEIRRSGWHEKLSNDIKGFMGNGMAGASRRLVCERGGEFVVELLSSSDTASLKAVRAKYDDKQWPLLLERSKLYEKEPKSRTELNRLENLDAQYSSNENILNGIDVALLKPFWVSPEQAGSDFTKSCLGGK